MEKGYLIVTVYADNYAQPVKNAEVLIIGENTNIRTTTDADGKTEKIELNAPDKKYSLEPQTEIKPYSVYNIEVSKEGLQTTIIQNVEIFPETTATQEVLMSSSLEEPAPNEIISLPEHPLWSDFPAKIPEASIKTELETANENRVLPVPIVPEYVIVHYGIPTNTSAANYYIPFTDYIKNVASHEIYSTWPTEAIKANVYAILSFTMNRIFTEWYRAKGYVFTITSSTAYDQNYIHGGTIYDTISKVVDEIFTEFIKLPNVRQPLLAQYNDGIKVNNAGWLSQWGSKNLADQGYTALQILRNYYSNSVYLDTAEIISALPTSFPGYNLSLGSCGQAVQFMQNELNAIRGNYPGIPAIPNANGVFDNNTQSAVRTFQSVFSLPVTGIVDFTTWYKIAYYYIAVSNMLKGIYG